MHLHNHGQHSVIDGHGLIEDYLKLAQADGQASFALTDHGSLGGIVDLYQTAHKLSKTGSTIKPIAGIELYVDAFELREKDYPGHLTVIARNEAGYRALIAANNLAHRQFYYRPRITIQQIIENNFAEDWYILTGCMSSPIINRTLPEALNIVQQLQLHSAGVFLEVMYHPTSDPNFTQKQSDYLNRIMDISKATQLPPVLTNDCHYATKLQETIHHDILLHSRGENGLEFDGNEFYFKTTEEMQTLANSMGISNAVGNAIDLSARCELVIPEADTLSWHVPDIAEGRSEEKLRAIVWDRISNLPVDYQQRYEYEMGVLATSPAILNSYLVAHDVVDWCAQRGITIAARGSMGGSLVSYLLGISLEDPVKYNLSFSRAVNPARPTIPDFDLDVSSSRRPEILDYLKQRYVGNIPIASYTHYGPKGAMRKVLRGEGIRTPDEINVWCKPLPEVWPPLPVVWNEELGEYVYEEKTDDDDLGVEVEFDEVRQEYVVTGAPTVEGGGAIHKRIVWKPGWLNDIPMPYRVWIFLFKGLYSSNSVHPSGILISGPERPIEHEVPFQWIASSKTLASSYDMYTLKKIGLFKLDVLGLRTLDQLAYMKTMSGVDLPDDNYDEEMVLAAFGADLLAEIFQMDGYACRSVLKQIGGANDFMDIVAANTLARPGASDFTEFYRGGYAGLVDQYPLVHDVLEETNGLILYQEQVMEIARVLADFDDIEQDDVKESIKYFRQEHWAATIEPKFRERCLAKGVDATNILLAISKMAKYTYNKAHALTYAAISYKMMWYKIHYPAIYYAAVFDDTDDKARLILESHVFGVQWHIADINTSEYKTVVREDGIHLGLSAIKGVGPAAFEAIRVTRPFTSLEDLMARIERRKCNSRVITAMKDASALLPLGERGVPVAFTEAFGFNQEILDIAISKELAEWMHEYYHGRLGGFVTNVRAFNVIKEGANFGKEMARIKVVNIRGGREAIFFPNIWAKAKGVIRQGAAVQLTGTYNSKSEFLVEHGGVI